MKDLKQDYKKMKIAVRSKLQGMKYFMALRAMEFAAKYHKKTRKDGSPEFSHQVSQAALALTLVDHFINPEVVIATIFLHDTCEDYEVSFETIEKLFGKDVRIAVELMTKEITLKDGTIVKIDNDVYYAKLSDCPSASIAKGFDRVHNLMTMIGGFTEEKQKSYIQETLDYTVVMLKKARRMYPEQEPAFENIKFIMTNQVQLYNALHQK